MEIGLANERMLRQLADLFGKFGIHGNISKKVHKAKSSVTGENFISWRFIVSDSKSLAIFCEEIGALGKEDKVNAALEATKKSQGSCNSYLPISHDDFIKHLVYEPQYKGKFGGQNYKVARDLPDELREQLNSWRKQTPSRISNRRYEAIRGYSDGYYDSLVDEDVLWDEIVSIESDGIHQTFDLTVEGNHNFIANGIITHNTQLSKATIIKQARIPNRYIWYVAPTYRMSKQIMWDELITTIPKNWVRKTNQTLLRIELKNNTIVELKGADKPDTLRGVGLHFIVLDEFQDMKNDVWFKVLRPTLATTNGGALFIGSPKSFNHLYDLWLLGQPGEQRSRQWKSWQFPTITSPFVPIEEIENARRDMDAKSFEQEFEASFVNMSGRVYYPFDRMIHVNKNCVLNPRLPINVAQDFNLNPMSSVICQIQDNGDVWCIDEIVLNNSNTEFTCDEIERRYWRNLGDIIIYPDPAGASKQHARGESDLDIFREKGFKRIKHKKKHPSIADRVNAVNRMLRAGNGDVRLFVNPKCRNLIESFEQTIYKDKTREIDKDMNIEHATDALGYFVDYEFPVRRIEIAGLSL